MPMIVVKNEVTEDSLEIEAENNVLKEREETVLTNSVTTSSIVSSVVAVSVVDDMPSDGSQHDGGATTSGTSLPVSHHLSPQNSKVAPNSKAKASFKSKKRPTKETKIV
jgi:hypothetical protein